MERREAYRSMVMQSQCSKSNAEHPVYCFTFRGEPIGCDVSNTAWQTAIRNAKLHDFRFHDLRHTSVSVLVRGSIDPVSIARRVGHGSAGFTLRQYAHLFNPDDRRAANALGAALRARATEAPAAADGVERQQATGP